MAGLDRRVGGARIGALPRLRHSKALPNYPDSIENVGARERAPWSR
jgi:hypothetical protein